MVKIILVLNFGISYKHANFFCLGYKKHNDNIFTKKLIMTYKKIKQKSRCSDDIANKSLFYRKKS